MLREADLQRNFICYLMFNILCWLDAAIVMILAILCCIPDRRMTHCYLMSDAIAAADRITGPEETVSFLSKSTFYYANKLLRYGASKTLTYDDFWPLSSK
ncbi:unnamed protein product [Toxocara canis]|uniref:Innexin n=1 Tax=Toxocara canis TaxID=6265 RepID=A0A183U7E7_TOXCA|nr:unnamed protein product [Toxocara canis]